MEANHCFRASQTFACISLISMALTLLSSADWTDGMGISINKSAPVAAPKSDVTSKGKTGLKGGKARGKGSTLFGWRQDRRVRRQEEEARRGLNHV